MVWGVFCPCEVYENLQSSCNFYRILLLLDFYGILYRPNRDEILEEGENFLMCLFFASIGDFTTYQNFVEIVGNSGKSRKSQFLYGGLVLLDCDSI